LVAEDRSRHREGSAKGRARFVAHEAAVRHVSPGTTVWATARRAPADRRAVARAIIGEAD
ncbi:MAG: hypothetical protein ACO3UM_19665, partial [Planctomycetota bacterium]